MVSNVLFLFLLICYLFLVLRLYATMKSLELCWFNSKRRYLIKCALRVSWIIFIRYARSQTIGYQNDLKVFLSVKIEVPKDNHINRPSSERTDRQHNYIWCWSKVLPAFSFSTRVQTICTLNSKINDRALCPLNCMHLFSCLV